MKLANTDPISRLTIAWNSDGPQGLTIIAGAQTCTRDNLNREGNVL